jgi:hypothetical protein
VVSANIFRAFHQEQLLIAQDANHGFIDTLLVVFNEHLPCHYPHSFYLYLPWLFQFLP